MSSLLLKSILLLIWIKMLQSQALAYIRSSPSCYMQVNIIAGRQVLAHLTDKKLFQINC